MAHETSLISTVAVGLGFAFVGGLLATRLRLQPIVGYLAAGVVVGPFTPGYVADEALAPQLAELGVMLLMFGVGMHFSIGDLLAVRRVAVPGAIGQVLVATAMGAAAAWCWGWPLGSGLVFGLALSVASTVVLLKALEARNAVETPDGRVAVGWLIVEDLIMVLALVMLPALAVPLGAPAVEGVEVPNLWLTLGLTLVQVTAFVALVLAVGTRGVPWLLRRVDETGSRELFTLAVVALALTVAYVSTRVFGVSFALGAFFAGVVVHGSDLSGRAERELRPIQDAFCALFFVSVGMLFDPSVLVEHPLRVLLVVAIIMAGKSVAAYGIVRALGHPHHKAVVVSAALGQIGEFSFILAALGLDLKLLTPEAMSLIVAGALLSIALNPLLFGLAARSTDDARLPTSRPAPHSG